MVFFSAATTLLNRQWSTWVALSVTALVTVAPFSTQAVAATSAADDRSHGSLRSTSSAEGLSPLLSPISPIRIIRLNPYLEVAFDVRTRTPVYALEKLVLRLRKDENRDESGQHDTDDDDDEEEEEVEQGDDDDDSTRKSNNIINGTNNKIGRRRHRFYEETSLPELYRSRNGHYHWSGYDRGHLAPAADFANHENLRKGTYNLVNIAPQAPLMNRTLWAWLESWTRSVARQNDDGTTEVYVVTGPLWLPARQLDEKLFEYQYCALGRAPALVAVPTHFFKVVAAVRNQQIQQFACFVVPNHEKDGTIKNHRLEDYVVRWSDLEIVSGLQFFPSLVDEEWKILSDAETDRFLRSRSSPQRHSQPQEQPLRLLVSSNTASSLTTVTSSLAKRPKKIHPGIRHLCQNGVCSSNPRAQSR